MASNHSSALFQVGASARASEDAEGGELAQLMESLGDSERAGAASARFGKGDKVRRCLFRSTPCSCVHCSTVRRQQLTSPKCSVDMLPGSKWHIW